MRRGRLLKDERGSAPLEAIFGVLLLVIFALGVIQVGLTLYARNVLVSSAHEGARAAIERGRTPHEAQAIATDVISRAAGGLLDDIDVQASSSVVGDTETIVVRVEGALTGFGVVPLPLRFETSATASRPAESVIP